MTQLKICSLRSVVYFVNYFTCSPTPSAYGKFVVVTCLMLNFIALFVYGQDGPKISFSETVWDIGKIKLDEEAVHTFKVINVGSEELEITQIRSSCRCLKIELTSRKIQPNEYAEIKAKFKEDERLGEVIKTIYIDSNDPSAPRSILRAKAKVLKSGTVSPQEAQPPTEPTPPVEVKVPKDASVCITTFISEDCDDCAYLKDKLLPQLSRKYPNALMEDAELSEERFRVSRLSLIHGIE